MTRRSKYGLFGSFRSRLLLVLAFAVMPAVGLIVYNTLDARADRARIAEREAVLVARFASVEQQRWIDDARNLLVSMSSHPAVLGSDEAACQEYLIGQLAGRTAYTVLGVTTATGERICNSIPDAQPSDPSDQVWFQRVHETRDFVVGDFQWARLTGQLVAVAAYPVLDGAGEIERIVAAALSLEWLKRVPAQANPSPQSSIVLLDANGTVIARIPSNSAYIAQSFARFTEFRAALEGVSSVTAGEGLDGVRRIFGFVPLGAPGGSPLVVRVGIPESEVYAEADAFFLRNIAGLALISLLALGVILYGSERLVLRNVRSLQRATQRVAAGDLTAPEWHRTWKQ